MSSEKRSSDLPSASLTRGITLMSVGVAALLVTVKAFAWMASGSVALLASLADSTLDLVASTITFFAVRYAAAPPDDDHRFGHGKAEAFASLLQAGLVFAQNVDGEERAGLAQEFVAVVAVVDDHGDQGRIG